MESCAKFVVKLAVLKGEIMELPETAVPIKGAVEHWIDVDGTIYARERRKGHKNYNRVYKKTLNKVHGYLYANIFYAKENRSISKRVHKLVAEAFIPNPDHFPIVEHKNNIKSDNRVENLYWTAVSKDILKEAGDNRGCQIKMFDTFTNELLGTYEDVGEASRLNNIPSGTIMRQCRYHRPVRKPFYFRFANDESV